KETSEEYSIDHDIHTIRTQVPVPFSKKLMDLTETICHTHDLTNKRMMSGAAHDAMYMTTLADTAMIFVPSMDGISHSPDEHTRMEDIHHGVTVLYDMM